MPKQSSMLTFLTPKAKRPLSSVNDSESADPSTEVAKKPAVEESATARTPPKKENAQTTGGLTPEDRRRIAENRLIAQIKRQATLTPVVPSTMGPTWFKALQEEFSSPYFSKLNEFVMEERKKCTVYPPAELVFSWSEYCSMDEVKVVILGQDPYHQPRQAHGLCFSVRDGVQTPPSLVNMYKELASDIPGFVAPKHGTLIGWAKQGVLLLNATLTVRASQANSHSTTSGWEKFTDAVIKKLSEKQPYLVFLLWGGNAQKKTALIDQKKHDVLKAPHPSPLSAHRGFLGCKHFSKTNELLKAKGLRPIDWTFLPPENSA